MNYLNFLAPMIGAGIAIPHLRATRGNLTFVSSRASHSRVSGHAAYIGSKSGLEGFVHVVEREVAGWVGVQLVRPGGLHTHFVDVYERDYPAQLQERFLDPAIVAERVVSNLEIMHLSPMAMNLTLSMEPEEPYLFPRLDGRRPPPRPLP